MGIVKIGILGVAGVLIALQFKSERQEFGLYIGIAVCLIIFSFAVGGVTDILLKMESLEQYIKTGDSYFKLLFKAVGITYVCEMCASVCKDAGYSAVAGQIEIFGKLSVLFMGMPILAAIIENISSIAG